jgi:uncharacterized protein (TIGR02271 family)
MSSHDTDPRPADDDPDALRRGGDELIRHEEELRIGVQEIETGTVRARKEVTTEAVSTPVTRQVEEYDHLDRVAPVEGDSGQIETLEDGSISIPILEEELVITKRLVVRERVILRKRVTTEQQLVEAELRREHISVEGAEPESDDWRPTA